MMYVYSVHVYSKEPELIKVPRICPILFSCPNTVLPLLKMIVNVPQLEWFLFCFQRMTVSLELHQ